MGRSLKNINTGKGAKEIKTNVIQLFPNQLYPKTNSNLSSVTSIALTLDKLENFSSPQFLICRVELTAMPYSTGFI